MPNYKTHDTAAYIAAPLITATMLYTYTPIDAAIIGSMFLIANHYFSPDLDIDSIMNRRWGVLSIIWWPYKRFFHHRSLLTHSGPLSATIRFVYFSLWMLPFYLYVYQIPARYILLFYISMVLADILHTAMDLFYGTF